MAGSGGAGRLQSRARPLPVATQPRSASVRAPALDADRTTMRTHDTMPRTAAATPRSPPPSSSARSRPRPARQHVGGRRSRRPARGVWTHRHRQLSAAGGVYTAAGGHRAAERDDGPAGAGLPVRAARPPEALGQALRELPRLRRAGVLLSRRAGSASATTASTATATGITARQALTLDPAQAGRARAESSAAR